MIGENMKKGGLIILFFVLFGNLINAQTYTYDNLNRLEQVAYENGVTITYSYDELGNRVSKTVSGASTSDLTVTNPSTSVSLVDAGGSLVGFVTHVYSGSETDADLPNPNVGYFLSTDCNHSTEDIMLATDQSTLGIDAPTEAESAILTIPSDTPSGTYYIVFVADLYDEISETDEDNNITCVEIEVQNTTLSTEEVDLQSNAVMVYPNPSENLFTFESKQIQIQQITIVDTSGKIILEQFAHDEKHLTINLSAHPQGVYFAEVILENGTKETIKLLKK